MALIGMGFLLAVGWFLFSVFCEIGVGVVIATVVIKQELNKDKTGLNTK